MADSRKKRIVFPFVEAGLGHIMPMTAVCDAFEKKYGDKVDIIKVKFFSEKDNSELIKVEEDFVKEVKLHNIKKGRGLLQVILLDIFGSKLTLDFIMQKRYKKAFMPAMDFLKELDADLIFNTHFSTLYYSCEAKERGLIRAEVAAYCPDPRIGRQWDSRVDTIALSSLYGKEKAEKGIFVPEQVKVVPFLIREKVLSYDKDKSYYRRELGIPADNFTVLLADGAYGAGKLKDTVYALIKSTRKMTVIAVCGKNEKLYQEFLTLNVPENICFKPFGFTDKTLSLAAACDLFVGKAGASNLAEPAYFGAPQIVTLCATPIEDWICNHYVKYIKSGLKITKIAKIIDKIEEFVDNPERMKNLQTACLSEHRADGPEILADMLYKRLIEQPQSAPDSAMNEAMPPLVFAL